MFVEFEKVFKKRKEQKLSAPDSLLAYISKDLPDGLSYTADSNGECYVTADSGELKLSGLVFRPNSEQQAILGDSFTVDELAEYMYNSQQQLPLQLETPGKVIINGQQVAVNQLVRNPFKQIEYIDGYFFASPKQFPPPFTLTLASEKYQRQLTVQRIANQSIHVAKFESSLNDPFILKFYVDTKAQTLQFSIALKLKSAHTVRDFVEAASLFNACIDGTALLEGKPISARFNSEQEMRFDEKSIAFWEKVLQIEEYIGVTFVPPVEDVDYETIYLVEQLFQSFVNCKPTRELNRINSITGKLAADEVVNPKEYIGKTIFSSFECESRVNLFGVELSLWGLVGQCNAVVSDCNIHDGKYTMSFTGESVDKPLFTAVIYFKDEDSMIAYRENFHVLADEMHKAIKPSEIINR